MFFSGNVLFESKLIRNFACLLEISSSLNTKNLLLARVIAILSWSLLFPIISSLLQLLCNRYSLQFKTEKNLELDIKNTYLPSITQERHCLRDFSYQVYSLVLCCCFVLLKSFMYIHRTKKLQSPIGFSYIDLLLSGLKCHFIFLLMELASDDYASAHLAGTLIG